MDVAFKYKIGQLVYYNNHLYRVLCETSDEDSKQYWKGLLRGYDRQIIWTQNNIDKLNSMIEEEQRNDEAYDDDIRQLRGMAHE